MLDTDKITKLPPGVARGVTTTAMEEDTSMQENTQARTMAEFVDQLMLDGPITWEKLSEKAKAEAEKRDVDTLTKTSQVKAHARFRSKQAKFHVEMDEKKVKMTRTDVEEQPRAETKKPSKKAAKADQKAKTRKKDKEQTEQHDNAV